MENTVPAVTLYVNVKVFCPTVGVRDSRTVPLALIRFTRPVVLVAFCAVVIKGIISYGNLYVVPALSLAVPVFDHRE